MTHSKMVRDLKIMNSFATHIWLLYLHILYVEAVLSLALTMQVALINGSVLVPPLIIGLNETACMCQSMQALASSVDPPAPASGSCQRASICSGVVCILTVPIVGTFDVEVDFEVCQDPPSMLVIVEDSDDNVLLDQYFNTSETVNVSVDASITITLDVVIENYDYSMIIQVYILQ